jgi:hypothetical protein
MERCCGQGVLHSLLLTEPVCQAPDHLRSDFRPKPCRWTLGLRLVRVWVTFKGPFPIRGATIQSVFGVAGTLQPPGLLAFLAVRAPCNIILVEAPTLTAYVGGR